MHLKSDLRQETAHIFPTNSVVLLLLCLAKNPQRVLGLGSKSQTAWAALCTVHMKYFDFLKERIKELKN